MSGLGDFAPVLQSFIGGVLALGGHWLTQWLSGKNALKSEERKLALELLLKVEKYCDTVRGRKKFFSQEIPPENEDPMTALGEEIIAQSQAFTDDAARDGMTKIYDALGWIRCPVPFDPEGQSEQEFVDTQEVKDAARALLGAVMRGQPAPTHLPTLDSILASVEDSRKDADWYYQDRHLEDEAMSSAAKPP